MNERSWMRCLNSSSDNRKSKIPNPKSVGFLAIVLTLACRVGAVAQQPAKIPKIGFLAAGSASASHCGIELFLREFRKLGYVEGKNITFVSRFADNKLDRLPALADELVRLKVDVIVTPGSNDTRAAKNATKTIPIVFLGAVSDPVALGLVDSLARPGGNITGFTNIAAVLAGKRLELLKETIPKLSRVAVLWNPQNPGSEQLWKESQVAGTRTGSATSFHGGKQRRQISRAGSKRQLRRVAALSP